MKHKYIPHTEADIAKMLDTIGAGSIDDLFKEIPSEVRLGRLYQMDGPLSEIEVSKKIQALADKNKAADENVCFLGAGAYDHYIPTIVKHLTMRSEFYTAYTPYQPEVAQGTLQYIFEFQTMMTELTRMDVSNASMYDGATATAEAMIMAVGQTRRKKVLVSSLLHPHTLDVIKTYALYRNIEVELIPHKEGVIDGAFLNESLNDEIAAVIVSNPNFYGIIEDASIYAEKIHDNKSLLIMNVNPLSLAILKSPKEMGADIVCGEAQPLGLPINFGGPYLGFLTATTKLMRKMPGRICGQTTDVDGKRAYVLTLQAREQHIRREKANSNICSNQSLNVLAATIYMSTLGKQGLVEVASQNLKKAHYAFQEITKLDQFEAVFNQPFFNEFVVASSVDYEVIKKALRSQGIIAGLHLGEYDVSLKNHILFCVTEKRTKAEIDQLISVLGGVR